MANQLVPIRKGGAAEFQWGPGLDLGKANPVSDAVVDVDPSNELRRGMADLRRELQVMQNQIDALRGRPPEGPIAAGEAFAAASRRSSPHDR